MSIHLLLGCMFSGKSTELFRRLRRYEISGKKIFLIKYYKDVRYESNNNNISTHDKFIMKCDYVCDGKLNVDPLILQNVDVIGIDEGQFYSDIDTFSEYWANKGKIIIIAALDSDFRREKFGKVLNLIPLAEEYVKLTAVCKCGNDAVFSKRITSEIDDVIIGGSEMYIATCRKCFFK